MTSHGSLYPNAYSRADEQRLGHPGAMRSGAFSNGPTSPNDGGDSAGPGPASRDPGPLGPVGRDWVGRDWVGRDWVGRDWVGRDWVGRDWVGRDWAGTVLGAATLAVGLVAGTYYAFSCAVMPGLVESDDRTFVLAMRHINEAIQNPVFFVGFFGALVLPGAAATMLRRRAESAAARWAWAALALYAVGFLATVAINIPLNDQLAEAATGVGGDNVARARDHFEVPWIAWNAVRAVLSTASLACLGRALVVHGWRRPRP